MPYRSVRPVVFLLLILPLLIVLSLSPVQAEPQAKEQAKDDPPPSKTILYQMFGRKSYVRGEPMTQIVDTSTYAAILEYKLTEHSSLIVRYSAASYGIDQEALSRTLAKAKALGIDLPPLNLSDTVRMHSGLLGYKYWFNTQHKMNPFVEISLGFSNPTPTLDKGKKLAQSAALGFQHKIGNVWSLYVEGRALRWQQRDVPAAWEDILDIGKTVTTVSSEFSLGLGRTL